MEAVITHPPFVQSYSLPSPEPLSWRRHLKESLALAWPVILSQLSHTSVQLADSIFVGNTNSDTGLASISLASSLFMVALVFGMGISMGLTPLVARNRGSGNERENPSLLANSFWLNMGVSALLIGILYLSAQHLDLLMSDKAVVQQSQPILVVLAWSLLPVMLYQTFRQYMEGLGIPKPGMWICIVANGINIALNWILVFGNLGFEAEGAFGSAKASFYARCIMGLGMAAAVLGNEEIRRSFFALLPKPRLEPMRRILTLGMPVALQLTLEVGAFSAAAIIVGWFGTVALSAHQIAISVSSVTYMGASGLASATTVRVGYFFGAKAWADMRRAVYTSYALGLVYMTIAATILVGFNIDIALQFIHMGPVATLASVLLLYCALYQLVDGGQVIGLGVLRGMGDVNIPTAIAMVAYWIVALPLGYALGFWGGLGPAGVWLGLGAGLLFAAVFLYLRFNWIMYKIEREEKVLEYSRELAFS